MANLYSFLEQTQRRPRQSLTPSSDPQTQGAQVRQSMSEPTFSPTGLLGDGYDLLRQEMEERSRAATQRPRESPFNGGLLGALDEYENQQMDTTRGLRTSSDTWGVGAGLSRTPSRRSYRASDDLQYPNRPRRTSSVSSTRTDSIYCAQTGFTPPPLLDMSSTVPQRQPSWRGTSGRDVRASTGQPLLTLEENSRNSWDTSTSLSRSRSMAVRSSGMERSDTWPDGLDSARLNRRVSSATTPARPTIWNEAARLEPARRGTLRRC
ncbi:unnamed protein product [Fusarium graminearum]|uniref:Uncharacterized protein n=1 Tax=Gibberella zeae TaxID=5518 RepID=A0A8H3K6U1_GIBZA|nr:unnamed protein product [Fusarium graminearum]CAG1987704.1 unnamed protein product [Fusarium graminearum]CAG1987942.1 unnamed protein product [Fusarium graminearum]CAG1989327.1 unnamed protein product [Fusarium graminearum]CZS77967.1 unnamed protein product [Fusarium graminearum]